MELKSLNSKTMDYNMKLLKSLSIHKKHFLKYQLTKLALSISLFSVLLSTWIVPYLLSTTFDFNSFDHRISSFPLRLLTHRVDKYHTFLLCNVILVFLAKSSGLIRSQGGTPNEEGGWRMPLESVKLENEEGVLVFENESISTEMVEVDDGRDDNEDGDGEEVNEVSECCSNEEGGEPEEDEDEDCIFEAGSGHGIMTAEELNRKFDDFIWKIREEISIGSAHVPEQQPVLG